MKFVKASERLPEDLSISGTQATVYGSQMIGRLDCTEYVQGRFFYHSGKYFFDYVKMNGSGTLMPEMFDRIEWLDASAETYNLSDLILVWHKAQEATYNNTSYVKEEEANELDYSYVEKERNQFFRNQFNITLPA